MSEAPRPGPAAFNRLRLGNHAFALPDAFVVPFDVAAFDEQDFARYGIAQPPSVSRAVAKRKAEYLAGRRAALAALCEAGSNRADLEIGPNRAPIWPSGFIGSISHSRKIAVAIALRSKDILGIGIDVEEIMLAQHMKSVFDVAIDEKERGALTDLAQDRGWPYALTVAFSVKESFYKATAALVGYPFDFAALRIVECNLRSAYVVAEVASVLEFYLPVGWRYNLPWVDVCTNCVATICVNLLDRSGKAAD